LIKRHRLPARVGGVFCFDELQGYVGASIARPWNLIVIAFSPYAHRRGGFHIRPPRQQLDTGPPPHRVGRLFAPCGRSNNEQTGAYHMLLLFLLCKEGIEEIPKLDKNTVLHKFDSIPFALRAYLCYNV
jgi:hypothetical protein